MIFYILNSISIIINILIILYFLNYNYNFMDFKNKGVILNYILIIIFIIIEILYIILKINFISLIASIVIIIYALINMLICFKTDYIIKADNYNIKYFNQRDIRWCYQSYSKSAVGGKGCVIAAITMINSIFNSNITMPDNLKWIKEKHPECIVKEGTKQDAVFRFAEENKLEIKILNKDTLSQIDEFLDSGFIFFILAPALYFYPSFMNNLSKSRHALLIVKKDGKIKIIDPSNFGVLRKKYTVSKILEYMKYKKGYLSIIGIKPVIKAPR